MDLQIKVDLAVLVETKAVSEAVEVSDNNQAINMDHPDLQEVVADLDNQVLCLNLLSIIFEISSRKKYELVLLWVYYRLCGWRLPCA